MDAQGIPSIHALIVQLAIVYSLLGFFVIFLIAGALDILRIRPLAAGIRKYFYSTFVVLIVGGFASVGLGLIKAPSTVAKDVTSIARSEQVKDLRSQSVVPSAASDPAPIRGLVYIQAPTLDDRPLAQKVRSAFIAAGLKSYGIEIVDDPKLTSPEVRYFNPADEPLARKVIEISAANGLPNVKAVEVTSYKSPPGQVELWMVKAQ